jgi:polyferredoxin
MLTLFFWNKNGLEKDAKYTLISLGTILTLILSIQSFSGQYTILFFDAYSFQKWYGFGIGAAFSGVLGVGFYPFLGSRVWCRFGCPMAAILGLQQRLFSRFRITTNGGQCISCGNCSTYCEMGIDVRAYAQRGENIVRSSCVGCGICASVCPRGVLKLENGELEGRINTTAYPLGNNMEVNP